MVGKARALVALRRAADALAILQSSAPEALEVRATALRDLGRLAEAEELQRKLVAATGRAAVLHARSTQG